MIQNLNRQFFKNRKKQILKIQFSLLIMEFWSQKIDKRTFSFYQLGPFQTCNRFYSDEKIMMPLVEDPNFYWEYKLVYRQSLQWPFHLEPTHHPIRDSTSTNLLTQSASKVVVVKWDSQQQCSFRWYVFSQFFTQDFWGG